MPRDCQKKPCTCTPDQHLDQAHGFCRFCFDLYSVHPDKKCPLAIGNFEHGGYFKIVLFRSHDTIVVDTLWQARTIKQAQGGGEIFNINGDTE